MRKITLGLLILLISQPILVYVGQAALLPTLPIHYGLLGSMALDRDPNHYRAIWESGLIPGVLLALRPVKLPVAPMALMAPLKLSLSWWLFGMNWLVLTSFFVRTVWLNWIILLWTFFWVAVYLTKVLSNIIE